MTIGTFSCAAFLMIFISRAVAVELRSVPTGKNVLLGAEGTEFQCTTTGRTQPHWLINGSDLDDSLHRDRGITIVSSGLISNEVYQSVLHVRAFEINNNTEIQCSVLDVQSEPAFFRIQGLLSGPPDLTVTALNFSTVHLAWSPPFTLNVTGNSQSSILTYSILVKNGSGETVLAVNSTINEYQYTVEEDNECLLATYEVCVAGVNGVGIGVYSQPVTLSLGFLTLSSFNTSIFLNTISQFSCEAFCHEASLVTWLINGSLLNHFRSSQFTITTRNDYSLQCSSNEGNINDSYTDVLGVLTESVDPFTVQCAGVYVCDLSDDVTGCKTSVCYSQRIQVEATAPAINNMRKTQLELTIGTGAGITAFFSALLLIILIVIICRKEMKKRRAAAVPSDINNETIYEQCGDPAVTASKTGSGPTMVIYDSPKSVSPELVDTQPCVAYDSTHPQLVDTKDTQLCAAYDFIQPSPPIMEPCVAYATSPHI